MSTCDIVIPTYNSARVLPLTLEALRQQQIPTGWLVRFLISDDGSTDDTLAVAKTRSPSNVETVLLAGPHSGAASARNRALAASRADTVFFLGADILLRPGALVVHLQFHGQSGQKGAAALGMVRWDPRLPPSPFMEWMVHGGPQNNFDSLLGASTADPQHFFFGSHVSITRQLIPPGGFPTVYDAYGWEDLDLGRQLARQGVRLTVLHEAVGLHHHAYTVDDVCRRQRSIGRGITIYQQRYPQDQITPTPSQKRKMKLSFYRFSGLRWLLWMVLRMTAAKLSTPRLFQLATAAEFWLGVYENEQTKGEKLLSPIFPI